jgi:hypothetical protein
MIDVWLRAGRAGGQAYIEAPAPPQVRTAEPTAAPAAPQAAVQTEARQEAEKEAEEEAAPVAAAAPPGSFGGLSMPFLRVVQEELEVQGFDLASADIMQQLASAATLPEDLLPGLMGAGAATGVTDPEVLLSLVRQWQRAIEQHMKLEMETKRKKQRPVWRCEACGRYVCPVAPYIKRYQD